MVRKYSVDGDSYLSPPYSKEEEEYIDRALSGDFVSYMIDLRSRQHLRQETREGQQEDTPPERKLP
jgi:hypothetical protein